MHFKFTEKTIRKFLKQLGQRISGNLIGFNHYIGTGMAILKKGSSLWRATGTP